MNENGVHSSSVQFMNLAHILLNKKIMNVSERGSYFSSRSRSFHVHFAFTKNTGSQEDLEVFYLNMYFLKFLMANS